MKEAALRYSPDMAEAFQPTLTLRPATKKSCAVFERLADQKPIQSVAMTVRALKEKIQGSMFIAGKGEKEKRSRGDLSADGWIVARAKVLELFCILTSLPMMRSYKR